MSDSPFLTIEQACERYQISRNTLKALCKEGAPVIVMGPRMMRIKVDLFDAWLEEHFGMKNVGTVAPQGWRGTGYATQAEYIKSRGYE